MEDNNMDPQYTLIGGYVVAVIQAIIVAIAWGVQCFGPKQYPLVWLLNKLVSIAGSLWVIMFTMVLWAAREGAQPLSGFFLYFLIFGVVLPHFAFGLAAFPWQRMASIKQKA